MTHSLSNALLTPDYSPGAEYRIARIDESQCIGCTRCIQACPVDTIVGAAKLMHTVIAAECIGCRHCLPPCPVDCIDLVEPTQGWTEDKAELAHRRYVARQQRLQQHTTPATKPAQDTRKAEIAAAVARSKAKKLARRHD